MGQAYIDYIARSSPSPFSPERLPQPGSSCFHLNYEGPGGEGWNLEEVVRHAARKSDCLVIYWQHIPRSGDDMEVCVAKSQEVFGLVEKYGFGQVFVRIDNKMPGWYIGNIANGTYADAYLSLWYYGARGIPPGISGNHEMGYVPTEGDIIAGQLYLPALQDCWKRATINGTRLTDLMAQRLWYIQFYNEVDFAHEWDSPPSGMFVTRDDGYQIYAGDYYLLGHWACSLTNGFSWFLLPANVVQKTTLGGKTFFSYDVTHLRIPILIPPVGTGNPAHLRDYLFGCLDSFHKIPIPDFPVAGGYYSPMYGPGVLGYSAHIYVPCSTFGYDNVQKVVEDLNLLKRLFAEYSSNNRFETTVRIYVTEFGCAQVGMTAGRAQQKRLYQQAITHILDTPLAWWVFAGRQCYSPYQTTTGRNLPSDWDVMAIVDYQGRVCDVFEPEQGE